DRFPEFEQNIDALMVDRQDNFWFSLKGDGVRYSNFSKSKIDQFGLDQGGEPLGLCNALFEDEENNIWILGDTAVIGLRDQKRVSYPIGIDGKSNDQTRFLYVDPLKNCWVGTLSGLYYKPSMAARFERINVRIDGLLPDKSPGYQDFTATPNGSFLISGNEGKIYYARNLDISDGGIDLHTLQHAQSNCSVIAISPTGHLASYSSNDSIMIAEFRSDSLVVDTVFRQLAYIASIVWDSTRQLFWLATDNGLQYVQKDQNGNYQLNNWPGYEAADILKALVLDPSGDLWMTASGQIIHYQPDENETYTYTLADGLQGTDFVLNSSLLASDGQIYFGGTRGVNVFRPAEVYPKMPLPRPGITGIIIDGDPELFWQYNGGGSRNTLDSQRLILPPGVGSIELHLSAREYSAPADCQFKYLLEGSRNADWVELGNEPTISLPNLAYGNYKLLVKATNSEGIWSEQAHTLYLRIRPPVYARWWFVGLIGLFVLALVDWLRRRRAKQLIEIANIKTSLERLILNPHVLFNGLAATKRLIGQGQSREAVSYLGRFTGYMRNLMQNSRRELIGLDDEIGLLEDYLKIEQLRMSEKNRFRYEIIMPDGFDPFDYQVPVLLLQPFVENAVVHGVKGLGHDGLIRMNFEQLGPILHIRISDNGAGRASTQQKSQAEAHNHNGVATPTTRRRIKLMNQIARRQVASFAIEDLVNKAGDSRGTLVHFELDAAYFNALSLHQINRPG
ncbi:MAG: histidine kinase, partial [Bacteroidota bacterium]